MKLTANVVGATGLVGKQLVKLLLENDNFEKVRIFVRRNLGIKHPKLEQKIIDFGKTDSWTVLLTGDVLFSTLGTTLKQAGSKEKQYEIDYTFNYNFALKAKENGIENYVLVSSVGADSASKMFYLHIKGKLDDGVRDLNFKNLVIVRPASLTGNRKNRRVGEIFTIPMLNFVTKFAMKKYRPIKDKIVAQAMINGILKPDSSKIVWEANEVFELAEK